jgi:peptidyl-prolyl cis-trans isomerase C
VPFLLNIRRKIVIHFHRMYYLFFVLVLFETLLIGPAVATEEKADSKVAVVNGTEISRQELNRETALIEKRMAQSGSKMPPGPNDMLQKRALESLVDRELLYQASKKEGIKVSDKEVQSQIEAIRKRFPDEKTYQEAMAQTNLTEQQLKTQIKKGVAVQSLVETKIASGIVVSEEEEKKFYEANRQLFKRPEEVKASHILIKVDSGATEETKKAARKKIESVQQELKKDQDFGELAKKYSEGPSGPNGGDLGYFRKGQMVKPFEEVAFTLPAGDVSDVVETPFGYHLIKVADHRPAQDLPFKEVQKDIAAHLKRQKTGQAVEEYVQKLEKTAKIERFI